MPGGTVDMGGQQIRFVSVHTTAPVPGYWRSGSDRWMSWGLMREHTGYTVYFHGRFQRHLRSHAIP